MTREHHGTESGLSPTEEIVHRCFSIRYEDIPEPARRRAHELVRDTVGVVLGSTTTTESSSIARDFITATYGSGPATVAGAAEGTSAPAAAFANATIAHGIELDDTHSGASIHPGAVIIPTVLAVGEREGTTGRDALVATVAGYELMIRISRAADPAALYARGFHPTSCCGVFGAALSASMLMECSLEEAVNAVGIAGSFSAGNLEYLTDGTLSKRIQPGIAAQAGVTSAELAARGYTGPKTILEGDHGFLQGYSDKSDVDRLSTSIDDDHEYEITRTGIKPHACCRYNQTPIDAVLQLQDQHGFTAEEVESIDIGLVGAAMVLVGEPAVDKKHPKTTTDAQFSVHYSVAIALREGRAFVEQYREPLLSDDDVLDLARRVTASHAEDLEQYYPDNFPAAATVRTRDGEEFTTSLQTCRGDPANPLSREELTEKYEELARRFLDEKSLTELDQLLRSLEQVDDVSVIGSYLRG